MCQSCFDTEATLHVHHRHYLESKKAWEYENEELITLCYICHEKIHASKNYKLDEQELIKLIRQKLTEKDIDALLLCLEVYTEKEYGTFFPLLPNILNDAKLYDFIHLYIGLSNNNVSLYLENQHLKKTMKQ